MSEDKDPRVKVFPPTIRRVGDPRGGDATWTLHTVVDPNACSQCGKIHDPEQPHDQQSLAYQYAFYAEHGVWPTWGDAMAHCDSATQEWWKEQLRHFGVGEDGLIPAGPTC